MCLENLFNEAGFTPTTEQLMAIKHVEGPLWLVAGPGSGKTRVLLWRTLNLIVFHDVPPAEIFLSTFTEKAARQLRQGLMNLLGMASIHTGRPYDISQMYVGTVHSLCRRILIDRRLGAGEAASMPEIMDEVDQYFHVYSRQIWIAAGQTPEDIITALDLPNFGGSPKHRATIGLIKFFNRLSEERITADMFATRPIDADCVLAVRNLLSDLYRRYRESLGDKLDFSLLQQAAFNRLPEIPQEGNIFQHIIIDEYQDTNRVQEDIFFRLTGNTNNLCVVGDDDQSLYRFRGATVENLVRFDERCRAHLKISPEQVILNVNFRSKPGIVEFYNRFILTDANLHRAYRLPKTITPYNQLQGTSVVVSNAQGGTQEIAGLVRRLIDENKVADPNQIAFLYPSVKSKEAKEMITALQQQGLKIYAPRSGRFLDGLEAKLIFGLLLRIFGMPVAPEGFQNHQGTFGKFRKWLNECENFAMELLETEDEQELAEFVQEKQDELSRILETQKATDWNLLDLFYRFCSASLIQVWLDQALVGGEGPIYNISLVSNYLSRYQKTYKISVIKASSLGDNGHLFSQRFFNGYLYGLYRLEQSEYEDQDNSFPKGSIPFITIHQAKGLEFPVVVLGSPKSFANPIQRNEVLMRPWGQEGAEPLENIAAFDAMRMFYVALSRAKNLLVLANPTIQNKHPGLTQLLTNGINGQAIQQIANLDITEVPAAEAEDNEILQTYSYTADYQSYLNCPRQYMLFRKYGFAPSRTQTMLFGSLVHKTIEDIHQGIIDKRNTNELDEFIAEMDRFIEDRFEENYRSLSSMTSHALAAPTQQAGLAQVLTYWQQCQDIALRITHTEVPLTLSNQLTPESRSFAIHGVVDMIKGDENPHMYDIKTHAAAAVRANPAYYKEQLNVYAHIWQQLNQQALDGISIVATKLPPPELLQNWNPVVNLPFNNIAVANTIANFGVVVDRIANRDFKPSSVEKLQGQVEGYAGNFATEVCGNCDGRYSCRSHQQYVSSDYSGTPDNHDQNLAHNKTWFLAQPDIKSFIDWLGLKLNTIDLHLNILSSNQVPGGLNQNITSINAIIPGLYHWKASWTDANGTPVTSDDWETTKNSLASLRIWLNAALEDGDSTQLLKACLAVLEWGGVSRAKEFLCRLHDEERLVGYMRDVKRAIALGGANISALDHRIIESYDSGLTKIHALLSDDGLPIYDSRVAAAMASFRHLFFIEQENRTPDLKFPVGAARGNQIRNLFNLPDHLGEPRLYSTERHLWAQAQVRLGWIMQDILEKHDDLFHAEGELDNRMHAFEAALFMIGYDLRCFEFVSNKAVQKVVSPAPTQITAGTPPIQIPPVVIPAVVLPAHGLSLWGQLIVGGQVPTSHNLGQVMGLYWGFRQLHPGNMQLTDFQTWLIINPNTGVNSPKAANAYCYPLGPNQFGIGAMTDADVYEIAHNPMGTFTRNWLSQWRCLPLESVPRCLIDVFIVGNLRGRQGLIGGALRNEILINGWAALGSAAAIDTVGMRTGEFFGFLLDPPWPYNSQPTQYFIDYFECLCHEEPNNNAQADGVEMAEEIEPEVDLLPPNPVALGLSLWGQQLINGYVPAGHNLGQIMELYWGFRQQHPENNSLQEFQAWLVAEHGFAPGAAKAYCYPLSQNQFGIGAMSDTDVYEIAHNPMGAFTRNWLSQWRGLPLENVPTCLIDVFIVGNFRGRQGLIGGALRNEIVINGWANTVNAAGALDSVGKRTGEFFGFLQPNTYIPTEHFDDFFEPPCNGEL